MINAPRLLFLTAAPILEDVLCGDYTCCAG
jgi:hypothetical protein